MDSWRMTSIYKFDRISCSVVKHSANFWSMRYCTQEKAHDYISMISGFYEISICPSSIWLYSSTYYEVDISQW